MKENVERLVALVEQLRRGERLTRREVADLQRQVWEIRDCLQWLERNRSLFEEALRAFVDPNASDVEKAEAKEVMEDAIKYGRTLFGGDNEGTLV